MKIKIRDDNGYLWYFSASKRRIVCEGDRTRGGGYDCEDIFEGLEVLMDNGYIERGKILIISTATNHERRAGLEELLDDPLPRMPISSQAAILKLTIVPTVKDE